jgi:tetratricopeptide (TPR) repeat protein
MVCFEQGFQIAESIGERNAMARMVGNKGLIYRAKGLFEKAIQSYRDQFEIGESLGDNSTMSHALGNMGNSYLELGYYNAALDCYDRRLLFAIGSPREIAQSLLGKGETLHLLGQHEDALRVLTDALEKNTSVGNLHQVIDTHAILAEEFLLLANESQKPSWFEEFVIYSSDANDWREQFLNAAEKSAQQCLSLSISLNKQRLVFGSKIILSCIEGVRKNVSSAEKQLQAMLTEAADEEQIADLHFWLWKVSGKDSNYHQALARYSVLVDHIPKFEFRKRIAELKGERIPKSADEED